MGKQGRLACVFCGDRDVSKQHIWPRWLRKTDAGRLVWESRVYHPSPKLTLRADYDAELDLVVITPKIGKFRHSLEGTVKAPCRSCNSGWMSVVESEAKEVALLAMTGETFVLDAEQARKLRAWAALLWAMLSYDQDSIRIFSPSVLRSIRDDGVPPGMQLWWAMTTDEGEYFRLHHQGGPVATRDPATGAVGGTVGHIGQFVAAAGPLTFIGRYADPVIARVLDGSPSLSSLDQGMPAPMRTGQRWPAKPFTTDDWEKANYGTANLLGSPDS